MQYISAPLGPMAQLTSFLTLWSTRENYFAMLDTVPSSIAPAPVATPSARSTPPVPTTKASASKKPWVDLNALPPSAFADAQLPYIRGNAPRAAIRQALDTFAAYGSRSGAGFGAKVAERVKFVKVDVRYEDLDEACVSDLPVEDGSSPRKSTSVTVTAEIVVDEEMTNGNDMLHGGCIAYLIDNVASVPLIVLGALRGTNSVGVTQALDVLYHAPAPLGTRLRIKSTTLSLGSRAMSARCEMSDAARGRPVATALLVKMEPRARL